MRRFVRLNEVQYAATDAHAEALMAQGFKEESLASPADDDAADATKTGAEESETETKPKGRKRKAESDA